MERANENPKLTALHQRLFARTQSDAEEREPRLVEPASVQARPAEQPAPDAQDAQEQQEQEVQTAAYGYIRGRNKASAFLEFQRRQGEWLAASYADLRRTRWRPSDAGARGAAFVLEFRDGLKVVVSGRNLRVVLEDILRQVVFRLSEMGEDAGRFLPADAPVIFAIVPEEPEDQPPVRS